MKDQKPEKRITRVSRQMFQTQLPFPDEEIWELFLLEVCKSKDLRSVSSVGDFVAVKASKKHKVE